MTHKELEKRVVPRTDWQAVTSGLVSLVVVASGLGMIVAIVYVVAIAPH